MSQIAGVLGWELMRLAIVTGVVESIQGVVVPLGVATMVTHPLTISGAFFPPGLPPQHNPFLADGWFSSPRGECWAGVKGLRLG